MDQGPRITLCVAILCAVHLPVQGEEPSADLQKLQGTWRLVAQDRGHQVPLAQSPEQTLFFGGKHFLVEEKGLKQLGTVSFDPSTTPKSVTMIVEKGELEGKTLLGIYELDGDSLRICLDTKGQTRPTRMETDGKLDRSLSTYKRIRAAKDEGVPIEGEYVEETPDAEGNLHKLDVLIERRGDAFQVTWKVEGNVAYIGTGLRRGNVFSVCWLNQGQVGLSVFLVEEGPRLVGHYAAMGAAGKIVPETLTLKKGSDATRKNDVCLE